jgi:hypothetical protein
MEMVFRPLIQEETEDDDVLQVAKMFLILIEEGNAFKSI